MLDTIRAFFNGKAYPIVVCLMMFVSYTTSTEVYINLINMFLLTIGLLVSDSIRPFIAVLPAYLYQFSQKTAMPTPEGLSSLLSGKNLTVYIISFSMLILALVVLFIKKYREDSDVFKTVPYPIAAIILSVAFLTNGLFSDTASFSGFMYGVVQIVTFFGIFYLFFLGLHGEDNGELVEYLSFVSACIAILILADIIFFYATNYSTICKDDVIDKSLLVFGWGISNTAGQCAAVLIPMCFYGVMKCKNPWFYFIAATLSMVSVFLTMSRNAMLFGSIAYIVCFILSCFFGEERKKFAIFSSATILGVTLFALIFKDTTTLILNDYVKDGLADNGRFDLWAYAYESFKQYPVFGKGFYGLYTDAHPLQWGFPTMMHNTPLQLLASMGAVGLVAYLIYRICTLVPFFVRPTLEKTMLGMSILVVLFGSLLDNFIFYIPHMLFYPIALAIAFRIYYDDGEAKRNYFHYITRW